MSKSLGGWGLSWRLGPILSQVRVYHCITYNGLQMVGTIDGEWTSLGKVICFWNNFPEFFIFRCRGCGFALRGLQEGLQSCLAANCTLPSTKGCWKGRTKKKHGAPGKPLRCCCCWKPKKNWTAISMLPPFSRRFGDDKGSRKNAACLKKTTHPKVLLFLDPAVKLSWISIQFFC